MTEHEPIHADSTESQLADSILGHAAGTAPALPEAARASIAGADRPEGGPRVGELWRARHPDGGPVVLVWVADLRPRGAVVVPATFDTELADEYTLIVTDTESPTGTPLALHVPVETIIDRRALRDRLGVVDVAAAVEAIRAARQTGEPVPGLSVGATIVSPLDERIEYRHALTDEVAGLGPPPRDPERDVPGREERGDWWLVDPGSRRAQLLVSIHEALAQTHPGARVTPRPATALSSGRLSTVALVAELDAFVLVASMDHPLEGAPLLEAARDALHADQLLNAVCLVDPKPPFDAVIVDRGDVVAAIETPSGELRPPRQSRPPSPVGDALTKFLDATISPFGRLASTFVDSQAIDPSALAMEVAATAVQRIAASARGYKVEGKRPGYERVTRHEASIVRLIESALGGGGVDVASIMEDPE